MGGQLTHIHVLKSCVSVMKAYNVFRVWKSYTGYSIWIEIEYDSGSNLLVSIEEEQNRKNQLLGMEWFGGEDGIWI